MASSSSHRLGSSTGSPISSRRRQATPLLAGMGASVTAREAAAPRTKNPAHDDRDVFQGRIDELPVIDIHSL
jgi:hypothetical protein